MVLVEVENAATGRSEEELEALLQAWLDPSEADVKRIRPAQDTAARNGGGAIAQREARQTLGQYLKRDDS